MSRARFLILSAIVGIFFWVAGSLGVVVLTDAADYVNDWTSVQREQHFAFLALTSGLLTSIFAVPLFAKRFRYFGVNGWWAVPTYLLSIVAFLVEAYAPAAAVMSSLLLILFGIVYLGMVFGEKLPSLPGSKQ
jgi:uncharacterized membrane protein YhaH (DUF805 family)